MVRLEEILSKINDLFAEEDFTPAAQRSWVEGVVTVLMDDDTIQTQAATNSKKQFMESPDLTDAVVEAVLGNQTSHNKMADIFFTDDKVRVALVHLLGELVHENLSGGQRLSSGQGLTTQRFLQALRIRADVESRVGRMGGQRDREPRWRDHPSQQRSTTWPWRPSP